MRHSKMRKTSILGILTGLIAATALLASARGLRAAEPEMVIQMGHTDAIRCAVLSADGAFMATGSMDGTVCLWEVETGRQIRTLAGHPGGALAAAFDPPGETLFSGGMDRLVKAWDLETGALVRTFGGFDDAVTSLAVRPDGTRVAAGSRDGSVRIWSVPSWEEIGSFAAHPNGTGGVVFASDGRLVTGGADGKVAVWQADGTASGVLGRHNGAVTSLAASPDGSRAASGGEDATVRAWDLQRGAPLWTASGHREPVGSVAFSADGLSVASGSWDGTICVRASASGDSLRRMDAGAAVGAVGAGPGGALFSGGADDRITLWSPDGRPVRYFEGRGTWVYGLALGPQGGRLTTAGGDGGVRIWDLEEGRMLRMLDAHSAAATSVAITPDGTRIVSAGGDETVRVWDPVSGARIHDLKGHETWVYSVTVSPHGKRAASGDADGTILIWDLASGRRVRAIEGHTGEVTCVAFAPDGERIVSAGGDETVRVWDVESGSETARLEGHTEWVSCVAVSPDGSRAVSGSEDGTARVWDLETGAQLHRLDLGANGTSAAVSPDGRTGAVGTSDGRIFRIDLEEGRILGQSAAHGRRVSGLAFAPDGRALFSGSRDGSAKVWDALGAERAALIGFRGGDWLAATPEGAFDCSIDGSSYVAWRVGREVFSFERYEKVFRRPNALRDRLQGRASGIAPDAPPFPGRPPQVRVVSPTPGSVTLADSVDVRVEVEHAVGAVRLSAAVNGRPALAPARRDPQPEGTVRVPLSQGKNRIAVTASDRRGLRSDPDTVTIVRAGIDGRAEGELDERVRGLFDGAGELTAALRQIGGGAGGEIELSVDRKKGDLWVLAVGVGKHSNPRFRLRFPPVDAQSMAEVLRRTGGALYREVHARVLLNEESTTGAVLSALDEISRRVKPEDVMLMFIAGHGIRDAEGDYYFITYDGSPLRPSATAFSWRKFQEMLARMPVRSIILFADTCYSGDIVKPGSRFAGAEEMVEGLVKDAGVMVFVSCRTGEVAVENRAWGHGAFTYALLEGLRGRANYHSDEVITMSEIQLYVPYRVRQLTRDRQHPRIPRLENFDPEMPLVAADKSRP